MSSNPFEFEAANKFTIQEMVDYFIPGETLTRALASRKNAFLVGDRGIGKTMALRFYSLPVQYCLNTSRETPLADLLAIIGVYIPCRKPDLGKTEPELLEPFLGRLTGEHFLVTAIIANLAASLESVEELLTSSEETKIRSELQFALQWDLPAGLPVFTALGRAARNESILAQRALNRRAENSYYENVATFATAFQPLIDILTTQITSLRNTHFSLMFDDAEDLSDYQNRALNSWIAVRDTSRISFKVATSAVDQRPLDTISGGGLLERHDFIRVDLEQDFQNSETTYGKLARKIVNRRLQHFQITLDAEQFFPSNPALSSGLLTAKEAAETEAIANGLTGRQIRDYVNKMGRALYFRARPAQANKPPYSGFDLLVHVSTGVIRYLLEPCYEMYDKALSASNQETVSAKGIPPSIQTDCLLEMSKRRWEWVSHGFNASVKGCTRDDSRRIFALLDQLAVLFRKRLESHASEPRAISFSISAWNGISGDQKSALETLLSAGRRAQILFQRLSTGKDEARSDVYYTFDRILWLDRGLDPVGQNARVSLEAKYVWEAAFENKPLPFDAADKRVRDFLGVEQKELFDNKPQ